MLVVIAAFFEPLWAAESIDESPGILFCTWEKGHGNLDLDYLKHLKKQGFTVDFLDSRHDFTWDRISGFNTIVLYDFPSDDEKKYRPSGRPSSGPKLTETLELLERYLQAGGGVFLIISEPIIYFNNPSYYFAAQKALKRWGAQLPMEDVIVPPVYQRRHPRLLNKLWYYTENIKPSPVSDGVHRLFYPDPKMVNDSWFASGPIDVDDTWQVVVCGPKGSKTQTRIPKSEVEKAEWPKWKDALRYETPVSEPPLIAIREKINETSGRLALMWCWERLHIGQGTRWNYNGVMLDKGLDGLPSDFDRLFQNTMRWLAEPSMKSTALGGATVSADRLIPQSKQPESLERVDSYPKTTLPTSRWQQKGTVFKGIIGPKTQYSGGKGTVAEYAAEAKKLGLNFIIFLEDLKDLDQNELASLIADCKKNSDDDLLLFPGYRIVTNLGNQIFFAGYGLRYPPKHLLGGTDGKTYLLQGMDKDGNPVPSSSSLSFQLGYGENSTVGFFDFTGPEKKGGLSIPDLRCFSMCGVRYYDHGKEIEDVTDEFLLTNEGSMSGSPVSINLVDSPQEMADELKSGHAVTYAVAENIKKLWEQALRWNHPFISPHVFPSDGPIINIWPGSMRTKAYGQDDFVVAFNHMPTRLQITADNGLKEISLYDGSRQIARYLPDGAKEFDKTLHLNATFQQNISVVVTDMTGKKAVSAPVRTWKAGIGELYCADHVNGGKMWLARGKCWQRWGRIPEAINGGHTWDGGPPSTKPLLYLGYNGASAESDLGQQSGLLTQIPIHILCDERVSRSRSLATRAVLPSLRNGNCWTAYGPMVTPELFDGQSTYTEMTQYPADVDVRRADLSEGRGNVTCIYEQDLRFLKQQTVKRVDLAGYWRQANALHVTMLRGNNDQLISAREVNPRQYQGKCDFILKPGEWFAGVSRDPGNAMLFINQAEPVKVSISPERLSLSGLLPENGLPVKKDQVYTTELVTVIWPVEQPLADSDALMPFIRYLKQPSGMKVIRGKHLSKPLGLVEFETDDGAVELFFPKPDLPYEFNLPVRINGLNRNWSCLLWQQEGQAGPYHGSGKDRIRPLGMDEKSRAYIPVTVGLTDKVHLVAGHPVVAENQNLVIRVVCLEDTAQGEKFRWHVVVHNPTDKPIETTVSPSISLPGLFDTPRKITIPAGSDFTVQHDEKE